MSMVLKVYGLDFTSAPSVAKPITCASAYLDGVCLNVEYVERFCSFADFELFLQRPGPWWAGFDFPFGQPRRLLAEQGRGHEDWMTFVRWVSQLDAHGFAAWLTKYRTQRSYGDRHHMRETDRLARSCSPMMLYGVPVAKMFFGGVPRLLQAGVSALPMNPQADARVAVEAYPKLVAQRYAAGGKYKADERRRQTAEHKVTRIRILDNLQTRITLDYGLQLQLSQAARTLAEADPTGDALDAVLCVVQAAWSARCKKPPHGIPGDCDVFEGWIVDPQILLARQDPAKGRH